MVACVLPRNSAPARCGLALCHLYIIIQIMTPSLLNLVDKDAQKGKKSARKTTRAGGSGVDLQKVAQEQQAKLEKERKERKEQILAAKEAAAAAPPPEAPAVKEKPTPQSKILHVCYSAFLLKYLKVFVIEIYLQFQCMLLNRC